MQKIKIIDIEDFIKIRQLNTFSLHELHRMPTCTVLVGPLPSRHIDVFFSFDKISLFKSFRFIRTGIGHLEYHINYSKYTVTLSGGH